jgi:Flp pilus assembly protein TadG
MGFIEWLQRGLNQVNRAKRTQQPPICAYCWGGGTPVPRKIKDISTSGAFLHMPEAEMWYPGTILTVLLQSDCGNAGAAEEPESRSVSCRVVRHGPDGIGVAFMFSKPEERKSLEQFLRRTLKDDMRAIVAPARNSEGQALVEFALMVPFLFLLILITVNFGTFLYGWITVANAARAGAQYAVLGGVSVGMPSAPSSSLVQSLITSDTSSLPSSVTVCVNKNATASSVTGTCSFTITSIPADPEAPLYSLVAVDVNYAYTSAFSSFSFPALGITGLPGMPSSIHRRVLMRILN